MTMIVTVRIESCWKTSRKDNGAVGGCCHSA